MKILFLVSNYPSVVYPYKGIFFKKIAEGLSFENNISVSVVAPMPYSNKVIEWFFTSLKGNHKIPYFEKVNNVEIYRPRYLRVPFLHKLFLSHYLIYPKVAHIINKTEPDLIDFRTSYPPYPLSKLAVLVKDRLKVPYIYTINGVHDFPHSDLNKKRSSDFHAMIHKANLVQAVSQELVDSVKAATSKKPLITVHPIDLKETHIQESKEDIIAKFHLPKASNYFLYAGQLSKEKGVDTLMKAFLEASLDNTKLILAGEGPLMNNVANDNIIFLGKVPNKGVLQLMKISSLFVFLTKYEGMPNVLKEAGAMKLPIITTKVGGIPELLNNGERGIILKDTEIDTVVASMKSFIENPDPSFLKAEKLFQHISEEYDLVNNSKKLVNTYKEIINV